MKNFIVVITLALASCNQDLQGPIKQASSNVSVSTTGLTVEQTNVKSRVELDNKPGAFKHLYIVNELGKCIFYDTVRGKVTSSGKRLHSSTKFINGFGDGPGHTEEALGEDGTYGNSTDYIYWWNVNNQYRQLTVGAGSNVLITEIPVRFDEVTIDLSLSNTK